MLAHGDIIDITKAEFGHLEDPAMERIAAPEQLILFGVLGSGENCVLVPGDGRFQQIGVQRLPGLKIVLAPGKRGLPISVLQLPSSVPMVNLISSPASSPL